MKVATVILILVTEAVAKHHHTSWYTSVLKSKSDFFGIIKKDVQSLMENIFDCVNLVANFSEQPNTKLLLTMHYDLSNIADKNIDAFKEILNLTRVNVSNRTKEMIKLDDVVEHILTKHHVGVYNKFIDKEHIHKHVRHKPKNMNHSISMNASSEFTDSKEFLDFVIDFLIKVNDLNIRDFTSKRSSKIVSFRRNLKVWEPPPGIELNNFNGTQHRRVYKGWSTDIEKFPFIVSIHIMGEFACAGCIISRNVVITAASCLQVAFKNKFFKHNPKSIYVRMGSDYTLQDGETIPAQHLYFHPMFEPKTFQNNLVLLRLERRIRFSKQQKKIRRILWDITPESLSPDIDGVLILGWGATKRNQIVKRHQRLKLDMLNLYDKNECKEIYSKKFVLKEHFCAGFVKSSGGACNGDVGGPGIVGAVLMGIISYGAPVCGTVDTPTVFTKLGYYGDWIESIINLSDKNETTTRRLHARRNFAETLDRSPHSFNRSSNEFRAIGDYPEEVHILREILTDLVKSNSSVLDELLYGDLYEDFNDIFLSTEKNDDMLHHPLVNKSLYALPGIHYPTNMKYVTMHLTTSSTIIPVNPILSTQFTTPRFPTPHPPVVASEETDLMHIMRKPYTDSTSDSLQYINSNSKINDYTDNYERSEEGGGMSIEVPSTVSINFSDDNEEKQTTHKNRYSKDESSFDTEEILQPKRKHKQKIGSDETVNTDKTKQHSTESSGNNNDSDEHSDTKKIDSDEVKSDDENHSKELKKTEETSENVFKKKGTSDTDSSSDEYKVTTFKPYVTKMEFKSAWLDIELKGRHIKKLKHHSKNKNKAKDLSYSEKIIPKTTALLMDSEEIKSKVTTDSDSKEITPKITSSSSNSEEIAPKITSGSSGSEEIAPKLTSGSSDSEEIKTKYTSDSSSSRDIVPKVAKYSSDSEEIAPKITSDSSSSKEIVPKTTKDSSSSGEIVPKITKPIFHAQETTNSIHLNISGGKLPGHWGTSLDFKMI